MRAETYHDFRPVYESRTIAVIGASANETKAAHIVPSYLQSQGYRIVPVNPNEEEVLGERAFSSLREIDEPLDVVEVFRPPAEAPAIARDAVAIGAKALWLQLGIDSEEAVQIADEAGLVVVRDRCMGIVHGELNLGPGVHPWLWQQRHYDEDEAAR